MEKRISKVGNYIVIKKTDGSILYQAQSVDTNFAFKADGQIIIYNTLGPRYYNDKVVGEVADFKDGNGGVIADLENFLHMNTGATVTARGWVAELTVDQLAAIDEANNPNELNPFATIGAMANYVTISQADTRDTDNRDRDNHTGTQLASTISDFQAEVSANIDVIGATNRANHTGTQLASTISDLLTTINRKDIKEVSSPTYSFVNGDEDKIIHFTNSTGCTVTVPKDLESKKRYEGKQMGDGQITFIGATDVNINTMVVNKKKTLGKYAVWNLDCADTNEYLLYGDLELEEV